jgi:hypothetical protein
VVSAVAFSLLRSVIHDMLSCSKRMDCGGYPRRWMKSANHSGVFIVRWFMALCEYSYEIEFIAGVVNGIADSMSRHCHNNMIDSPTKHSKSEILSSTIIPKFKLTDYQYKTISSLHNSNVGHFGLERTMKCPQDVNKRWEFQRNHVR